MKILNIHGLYGDSNNTNYKAIVNYYKGREDIEIISPQLDLTDNPYSILTELGDAYDLIVGNSFGGFFAYILGSRLKVPTLLTNPYIPPSIYIPNLVTGYKYTEELITLWDEYRRSNLKCSILLGDSDEVLDSSVTLNNLNIFHTKVKTIPGGHSLEGEDHQKWLEGELI